MYLQQYIVLLRQWILCRRNRLQRSVVAAAEYRSGREDGLKSTPGSPKLVAGGTLGSLFQAFQEFICKVCMYSCIHCLRTHISETSSTTWLWFALVKSGSGTVRANNLWGLEPLYPWKIVSWFGTGNVSAVLKWFRIMKLRRHKKRGK